MVSAFLREAKSVTETKLLTEAVQFFFFARWVPFLRTCIKKIPRIIKGLKKEKKRRHSRLILLPENLRARNPANHLRAIGRRPRRDGNRVTTGRFCGWPFFFFKLVTAVINDYLASGNYRNN